MTLRVTDNQYGLLS